MKTNKLKEKLNEYLDLSKKKKRKKRDKLLKIIGKLENKKSKVEQEFVRESLIDKSSAQCKVLSDEVEVLSRLIKKAKKQGRKTGGKGRKRN
jgi:bacterioferritin (cytochrome b1)